MAAAVVLYGSSPPSIFTNAGGHQTAGTCSHGDIDIGKGCSIRTSSSLPFKGGLSTQFAGTTGKHSSMGHHENVEMPCLSHVDAFNHGLLREGSGSHSSICSQTSSSIRFRDRSPASVLGGVSSGRSYSSPLIARIGWENSGSAGGNPPMDHSSTFARRKPPSEASRPLSQSVGFRIGTDGGNLDNQPPAGTIIGFHIGSDSGDRSVFSFSGPVQTSETSSRRCLDDTSEMSLLEPQQDHPSEESNPAFAQARLGQKIDSWELLSTQDRMLRMVEDSFNISTLAESPPRLSDGITDIMTETEQSVLLKSQLRNPIFSDALVQKAFRVAANAHRGQVRKSGDSYLEHCVETAHILAATGSDSIVVAAGMLHDTLDDSMLNENQLRILFGNDVADLVVGVSKLSKFSQLARDNSTAFNPIEAERLHTMFLAMVDVRVVLLKLADRLHNLRTLDALPPEKQQRIARESVEVFAPLANRLGIWSWKAEIEDLCFKYLMPQEHQQLVAKLAEGGEGGAVMDCIRKLDASLRSAGIQFNDLSGRPKNLYSIYRKMIRKGRTIEKINDVRGLRLIVSDEKSCYDAVEVIHKTWPSAGIEHFKDYVKNPKANGYSSLHTVVVGPDGLSLEVQVRTVEMHHAAEYGLAAHWRYKEGNTKHSQAVLQQVEWARWVLTWHSELLDTKLRLSPADAHVRPPCPFPTHLEGCPFAQDFTSVPTIPTENDSDPVYVLMVDNDKMTVRELPAGATASDILMTLQPHADGSVHRSVKVNHEYVDPSHRLRMGDLVEATCNPEENSLWPTISLDTISVERERQRLAKCFQTDANGPPTPTDSGRTFVHL